MTASDFINVIRPNGTLRTFHSVCAVLLSLSLASSAVGQERRPQDRIVSPSYMTPPTQPQAAIPRLRPVASPIVRASAETVTVVEPRLLVSKVPTEAAKPDTTQTEVAATEGSLGPGPDFASQLPDDDSHMIQFIEVMQWTVLVLIMAVVGVIGLKKYGRGNLIAPQNSAISLLATLPVKNFFQAHLLQIGSQKFLVTTDRSGVKTVNPINAWDDLDSPVLDAHDGAIAA